MKRIKKPSDRRRKPAGRQVTVPYNHTFMGQQLRPNASIPISAHEEIGMLLKSVLFAAPGRDGVRNRIDAIRSELDEWAMRECTTQGLDQDAFNTIYYHGRDRYPYRPIDRDEMIRRIETSKQILTSYYPDCSPLNALMALADKAVASIRAWKN